MIKGKAIRWGESGVNELAEIRRQDREDARGYFERAAKGNMKALFTADDTRAQPKPQGE